jgi:hypothetical protein
MRVHAGERAESQQFAGKGKSKKEKEGMMGHVDEAQNKETGCRWESGRVNSLRGKESKSKLVTDIGREQGTVG